MELSIESAALRPGPAHDVVVRHFGPHPLELYWIALDEVEDLAGDGLLVDAILLGVEPLKFAREFGAPNTYAERLVFERLSNGTRPLWEAHYHLTLRIANHGKASKELGGRVVAVPVRATRYTVATFERLEPEPTP